MNKILITGGCGFIGSHLVEIMVQKGFNVKVFDKYNSDNKWGWLDHSKIKNELEVELGDIRDFDSVYKSMKDCKAIIHLAALIGIPYSYVSPLAYLRTNVEGTYNVLEASKLLQLNQVIITSTSEIYGSAQYIPIDEKHPTNSQSPYAASKNSADQLSLSYYRSFQTPIKIVRPFNAYGPRQSLRAIIPTIISQCLKANDNHIEIGNLSPTRDFTYVTDTCEAFIEIFNNNSLFGDVINVGSGFQISIKDIIDKIQKLTKKNLKIIPKEIRKRGDATEVDRLFCDNKKIFQQTNWNIENSLDDGLKKTILWFEENEINQRNNDFFI